MALHLKWMFDVDVARLVRAGQVEESRADRVLWLWDEIRRLKREKNAFVPAHNYQVPEVQAIADTVGDFFRAGGTRPRCEGAPGGLLRRPLHGRGLRHLGPQVPVYLPNSRRCARWRRWMQNDLEERQEFLRSLGRKFATMTYVNTYASVKALSDVCCTSSNAVKIADRLGVPDLLFVPDQNLAYQVALQTRRMYLPPPEPHQFHPREYLARIEPLIRNGERAGLAGNVFAWKAPVMSTTR